MKINGVSTKEDLKNREFWKHMRIFNGFFVPKMASSTYNTLTNCKNKKKQINILVSRNYLDGSYCTIRVVIKMYVICDFFVFFFFLGN